jgi:hypothetical protein
LRNLGHNLTRVWKRFKRAFPGASFDNYNGVVKISTNSRNCDIPTRVCSTRE